MRMTVKLLSGGEVRRRRANPALAMYRWRYEVALLVVLAALVWLGWARSWADPLGVVLVAGAVLVIWPSARRSAAQRCRSVLVQHRLRSAFHELCLTTWLGRSPAILWTAPRRDVLRVHLLCPAGIAASHFTPDVLDTLAAACDVPEVRVEPNPRHSALLVLVVVTRVAAGGRTTQGRP